MIIALYWLKEPLIANDILGHKSLVVKKMCNSFSDSTIQRYYQVGYILFTLCFNFCHNMSTLFQRRLSLQKDKGVQSMSRTVYVPLFHHIPISITDCLVSYLQFNTALSRTLTNLKSGEQCVRYQLASIPGSNTFIVMVNETCELRMSAFCPCSIVSTMCPCDIILYIICALVISFSILYMCPCVIILYTMCLCDIILYIICCMQVITYIIVAYTVMTYIILTYIFVYYRRTDFA